MLPDKLIAALIEAERFLEKAKEVDQSDLIYTDTTKKIVYGDSVTSAIRASVRRASLDLSRALIELRKRS